MASEYHNDHLGTPLALTDKVGVVVAEWKRDPFGMVISKTGSVDDNNMFPGQFWDSDAGLAYNWNRWYSPEIGRYVEADPLIAIGDPRYEPYGYAGANPLLYIDDSGLACSKGQIEGIINSYESAYDAWYRNRGSEFRSWGPWANLTSGQGRCFDYSRDLLKSLFSNECCKAQRESMGMAHAVVVVKCNECGDNWETELIMDPWLRAGGLMTGWPKCMPTRPDIPVGGF